MLGLGLGLGLGCGALARRLAQGGEEGLDEAQTTEVVDFEALLRSVS